MHTLSTIFIAVFLTVFVSGSADSQWVQIGPYGGNILSLAVSGANLFAGTESGGVFLSTNNGTSWTEVNSGLNYTCVLALVFSDTNLFAGTDDGGVFLSTNNGTSWTAVNTGLTSSLVKSFAVSGTNLFAGTFGGVFLSTNNGTSWTPVNSGLAYPWVEDLAVSGSNLFAGTDGGGVFLSTNNGTSWIAVDSGLTDHDVYVFAVSGTNLFAGTYEGGVYLSTNYGTSWTEASNGFPKYLPDSAYYPTVSAFTTEGTNLFAGTRNNRKGSWVGLGVYLSTDNGTNWNEVSFGIADSIAIKTLYVNAGYLFAGTSRGVWRRPLSEMVTSMDASSGSLPAVFNLAQNYPNPFNPSTTISYQIPKQGHVTLKVFDMLGREVSILVNGVEEPGHQSVTFDACRLSSGVYYYRMQAGNYVETKKLLLLR